MTTPETAEYKPAIRTVRMHLSPLGRNQLFVGDVEITNEVRGLRLSVGSPDYVPAIVLDLALADVDADGEAVVHIEPKTRDALVALGWTPPLTDPEAMREAASLTAANEAEASR